MVPIKRNYRGIQWVEAGRHIRRFLASLEILDGTS